MRKLSATERRMIAEVIVKKINDSFKENPEKEKLVDEYFAGLGFPDILKTFKESKKEYDKINKKINELIAKRDELSKIMRNDPLAKGYSGSIQNYEKFVDYQFTKLNKVPFQHEIETKILLSGSDDLSALIESIVNEYKQP
jgi:Txe/YoeB family toxin of Txe-Axe toxin-antitoxin module